MNKGFTLIELLISLVIFAFIATLSYKMVNSLLLTKEVTTDEQNRLANLSGFMANLEYNLNNFMPVPCRDNNGKLLLQMIGKTKLSNRYDGQLEFSVSGHIGKYLISGIDPPHRVAYRFIDHKLYLLAWAELNRAPLTVPQVTLLLDNVDDFNLLYEDADDLYDSWPRQTTAASKPMEKNISVAPQAIYMDITIHNHPNIRRIWSL